MWFPEVSTVTGRDLTCVVCFKELKNKSLHNVPDISIKQLILSHRLVAHWHFLTHLSWTLKCNIAYTESWTCFENIFMVPFSFHRTKCHPSVKTERSDFSGSRKHILQRPFSTLMVIPSTINTIHFWLVFP